MLIKNCSIALESVPHFGRALSFTEENNHKNRDLNYLRKIICLRKSEVSVERISVCNGIENFVKHGIQCLPCSYTDDVMNMLW